MGAADLDYEARTLSGCIPPHRVSRLLGLGHAEEVESQAVRGEWFCAQERARLLAGQDRQAQASEVLAPYVATGWWKAAETTAELLEERGRAEEAIALARHGRIEEPRTYAAAEWHGHAAQRLAELLDERGDLEGAIAVYRQPVDSPARQCHGAVQLAQLLVRHGRGEEVIEVMRTLADSPGGAEDWVVDMPCTLYAGQGLAEEGRARRDALKTRRGEEEWDFFRMRLPLMVACELREEAIGQARAHPEGDTWYAARSIAELLAGAGRTEEAVAVLEQRTPADSSVLAWRLIGLGRVKDAVALLQQRGPRPAEPLWTGAPDDAPPLWNRVPPGVQVGEADRRAAEGRERARQAAVTGPAGISVPCPL